MHAEMGDVGKERGSNWGQMVQDAVGRWGSKAFGMQRHGEGDCGKLT